VARRAGLSLDPPIPAADPGGGTSDSERAGAASRGNVLLMTTRTIALIALVIAVIVLVILLT
jgi:hypothetical protein